MVCGFEQLKVSWGLEYYFILVTNNNLPILHFDLKASKFLCYYDLIHGELGSLHVSIWADPSPKDTQVDFHYWWSKEAHFWWKLQTQLISPNTSIQSSCCVEMLLSLNFSTVQLLELSLWQVVYTAREDWMIATPCLPKIWESVMANQMHSDLGEYQISIVKGSAPRCQLIKKTIHSVSE
jgi:hypothetical protein